MKATGQIWIDCLNYEDEILEILDGYKTARYKCRKLYNDSKCIRDEADLITLIKAGDSATCWRL